MSNHTPGPWEVRKGRCHTAIYQQGTDHNIAIGITSSADASLIRAAPQLLAALQAVVAVTEHNPEAVSIIGFQNVRAIKAVIISASQE